MLYLILLLIESQMIINKSVKQLQIAYVIDIEIRDILEYIQRDIYCDVDISKILITLFNRK